MSDLVQRIMELQADHARVPSLTEEEWSAIIDANQRGVTWKSIHSALPPGAFKTPDSLRTSTYAIMRRRGIKPQRVKAAR